MRRGGREALEIRSGMEEDEWQPVMLGLATWWRHSNLMKLVILEKGKHSVEGYVITGQRKNLYRKERDCDNGPKKKPCEKAEIQCWAFRRGKNLAFSKDTCFEKKIVWSKVIPRKVGVELEPNKRRLSWRLAWWESTEKKKVSHFLGLRGRYQCSDQRSNRKRVRCMASTAVGTEGKEDQIARSA